MPDFRFEFSNGPDDVVVVDLPDGREAQRQALNSLGETLRFESADPDQCERRWWVAVSTDEGVELARYEVKEISIATQMSACMDAPTYDI